MVALDANILLRALVGDEPSLEKKASALIAGAKPADLLVDRLILAECSYVLRSYYHFEKSDIAEWLAAVMADERFVVPDDETVAEAVRLFAAEQPLSLEDCYLLALKHRSVVNDVATFDQALQKRSR